MSHNNLVLIGMPGSGKSTVGVVLAKQASMDFIDTDVLIQTCRHMSLQDIVDRFGVAEFRKVEEEVLLTLDVEDHVISTGGSVVYSPATMAHLKATGITVFLDVSLETLHSRINNFDSRGIARQPGQSFEDLYQERLVLYRKYADITIDCNKLTTEEVSDAILRKAAEIRHTSAS